MKKTIIKIALSVFLLCTAVVTGIFIYYFSSTMSADAVEKYCLENSQCEATKFTPLGDGKYGRYMYWIASDGKPDDQQEIFVFRVATLFGRDGLNRYRFILTNSETVKPDGKVGCISFFGRKFDGEKDNNSTLIYYGSTAGSNIATCTYTLTNADGSADFSRIVKSYEGIWFEPFYDICDYDDNSLKKISNVRFYDADGKLVSSTD